MSEYNFEYLQQFHYLCIQNCLYQLLSFFGYRNANQYMDCAFNICIYKDKITFLRQKMTDIVIPPIKNNIKIRTVISKNNAWSFNREILKNKEIFIAIVDVYYLYYRKEYEKIHGAHAVIVIGYDDNAHLVNIVDCYEPYFFNGNINLDDFLRARSSNNPKDNNPYSGWPIYNKWIEVKPNFPALSSKDCILINIRNTLFSYNSKNDNPNILCGIDALKYLYDISVSQELNQEFWSNLHNDMFSIWRLFNLFVFNFSEVAAECNYLWRGMNLLNEYNSNFQELLYVILKQSIKESVNSLNRFCKLLSHQIELTSSMYDLFESINTTIHCI